MHAEDRQVRQHRVAVLAAVTNDAQARNRRHVERARQILELHRVVVLAGLVVDFLQRVDVAVELFQHRGNARRRSDENPARRSCGCCTSRSRCGARSQPAAAGRLPTSCRARVDRRRRCEVDGADATSQRRTNQVAVAEHQQHERDQPVVDLARILQPRPATDRRTPSKSSVPGRMPIAVPTMKCHSLTRTAPATTPSTANGASGTSRNAVIASRPRRRSTCRMPLSLRAGDAPHGVAIELLAERRTSSTRTARCRASRTTKPSNGPNAITANSVISGRGNIVSAAGV